MSLATRVFAHLAADNAPAYRAVLEVFVSAKERFLLHLRPGELWEELSASRPGPVATVEALHLHLAQLVEWGNLLSTPDGGEVRTVEDFYKARFLYQLSREGEAAEAALAVFRERLEAPGELQTAALADIVDHLSALQTLLAAGGGDAARVHQTISQLFARFDGLAEQARRFLASLRRSLDLRAGGVDDFLAYKEHLVGYVERFLRELTATAGVIAQRLDDLEGAGVLQALERSADRELTDRLRQDETARCEAGERWRRRWAGLRSWFIGSPGRPPQSAELRAQTRAGLGVLLQALGNLHDARLRRSDRVADLRTLARWFAGAADDAAAHALFHQAFLLSPTRHLLIDDQTLTAREEAPVPPATSWLDDRPMRISPRLRRQGRLRAGPGQRAVVLDHSLAKAQIQARLAAEADALHRARALIATGWATRLSQFPRLDASAFAVLLDCLGAVLSVRCEAGALIEATSLDGSLRILGRPIAGEAEVRSDDGRLLGPDLELTISEAWA